MTNDLVGNLLDGKYQVGKAIGQAHAGGMVYRGMDVETGAPVVIRCPSFPSILEGAALASAIEEFLAEAELYARVCQATTDVERVLASGVETLDVGNVPFSVFEWLAGRSLERHLAGRQSGSSIGEALVILEPAARALAAAHAIGAAHRDIRPANLWLAEVEGRTRMKVAAFGLATRIGKGDAAFAPEYGAPEHFKSSYGAIGPATDVYGLALTIVEMISGRKALTGADAGDFYLATSDLAKRPTLRARGAQVSDAVEAVIARALAVDPKRRWANARELWDALVAAVPELTPAAPSVRPIDMSPPPLASYPPGIASGAQPASVLSLPPAAGSTPSLPPVEDARLTDSMRARISAGAPEVRSERARSPSARDRGDGDRSGAWAWLAVVGLGALAIIVVVAKVGRSAPNAHGVASTRAAPSWSAPSAAPSASPSAGPSAGPDAGN